MFLTVIRTEQAGMLADGLREAVGWPLILESWNPRILSAIYWWLIKLPYWFEAGSFIQNIWEFLVPLDEKDIPIKHQKNLEIHTRDLTHVYISI